MMKTNCTKVFCSSRSGQAGMTPGSFLRKSASGTGKRFLMFKNYTPIPEDHEPNYLGIFTKNKQFYKGFFGLLIFIALQMLAAFTVNLVDNIMLGTYSELSLSGATLVNQLQFMMQMICGGIGMGIVVLSSQYWGQRRLEPIKKIISLGLKFGFLAGLIFTLATALFPYQILGIFTNDTAVIAEGVKYLRIMCFTYVIFGCSNSLMSAMQSVESAGIGTVMSVSTIIINLCLNSILIYGNLGAPEMGIRGAAIATLVSRSVELVIVLVYILAIDKKLRAKLRELLQFDMTYLRDYIRVSMPVVISGALWGVGQAAQTVILGHINATTIAANSIATVIFQIFTVFGFACSNTASVTTGKTIGRGELHLIRSQTKTMQGIFLCIGLVTGLLIFLLRVPLISIYSISDETRDLALQFLIVLSISTVGSCYEYPVESGIIAGGGTTRYPAVVDNCFIWLFTLPTAYLSAFVFHFPPLVTFCFLKADQILKCIPNSIIVNRYHWVKILTK